jgi:hypothetical protein
VSTVDAPLEPDEPEPDVPEPDEPEPDEPEPDELEPDCVFGDGGPTVVTRPGTLGPDGRMIDTTCPALTDGSSGVRGTVTVRAVVVTWYG